MLVRLVPLPLAQDRVDGRAQRTGQVHVGGGDEVQLIPALSAEEAAVADEQPAQDEPEARQAARQQQGGRPGGGHVRRRDARDGEIVAMDGEMEVERIGRVGGQRAGELAAGLRHAGGGVGGPSLLARPVADGVARLGLDQRPQRAQFPVRRDARAGQQRPPLTGVRRRGSAAPALAEARDDRERSHRRRIIGRPAAAGTA